MIFFICSEQNLVNEKPNNADSDGCICNIENSTKEFKVTAAKPLRPLEGEKRKVKHIDNFSLQEGCIASRSRKECGNLIVTLTENEAIKAAVNNIT